MIDQLREELLALTETVKGEELSFAVESVDVELHVGVTKEATGGAKAKLWVLELGAEGKYGTERTQTIKLTLKPRLKGADGETETRNPAPQEEVARRGLVREHVVLIASEHKARGKTCLDLLGTGTVVAPGIVLTAHHVVFDDHGKDEPGLVVRREGSAETSSATVVWPGSADLDVALLAFEPLGPAPSHPLAVLSARNIRVGELWTAHGYPEVRKQNPSKEMEKVSGTCEPRFEREASLWLDAPVPPDVWEGLSGAAVVVEDQIVGVVRGVPKGWTGKRVSATPVAAFVRNPGFCKALGLGKVDEQLEKDVDAIEADLAKRLGGSRAVCAALARNLGDGDGSGIEARVAAKLVRATPAEALARVLADLDAKLPGERDVVRGVLWQVIAFAADRRALVRRARAALADHTSAFDSPLRTETLAENRDGGRRRPAGPLRPRRRAPGGRDAPAHARGHLRAALRPRRRSLRGGPGPEPRHGGRAQRGQWSALGSGSRGMTTSRSSRSASSRPPRARMPPTVSPSTSSSSTRIFPAGKDADALWTVVCTAVGKELRSLRVVRLTGGGGELGEEYDIAEHIRAVRDRL